MGTSAEAPCIVWGAVCQENTLILTQTAPHSIESMSMGRLFVDMALVDMVLVDMVLVDMVLVDMVLVDMVLVDMVLVDMVLVDMVLVDMVLVDMVLVDMVFVDIRSYTVYFWQNIFLPFTGMKSSVSLYAVVTLGNISTSSSLDLYL